MASSYEGSSSLGGGGESGMFTLDMEEGVEGGWSWPWRSRQCAGEIMGLIRVQIREREGEEKEREEKEREEKGKEKGKVALEAPTILFLGHQLSARK